MSISTVYAHHTDGRITATCVYCGREATYQTQRSAMAATTRHHDSHIRGLRNRKD